MTTEAWQNDWSVGRRFHRLPVTRKLSGDVTLPFHVVTGARKGPTLALTAAIHGDETSPAMMIRDLLDGLDPEQLQGRVVAVPVCNPPAVSAFARQTPEQHGKTDLHEVFPGNMSGNLTQMLASVIATQVIAHADVLIDYHCGGSGGRLQDRVDVHQGAEPDVYRKSLDLARAFGTTLVHKNNLGATAVGHANALGKVAFNAETGGVYLAPGDQEPYMQNGVAGFRSVMAALGVIEAQDVQPERQLVFSPAARHEANPKDGGYLVSEFQRASELGTPIEKGTLLGTVVDLHSFEVMEELRAPVDGLLVFSRYSGAVDSGTKSFALAETAASEWLER